MSADRLTPDQRAHRADKHLNDAFILKRQSNEWSAVCAFYCAYHSMRYAIETDPVWDDPTALANINSRLRPGDRGTSRHHGHFGHESGPGVNRLVLNLYRDLAASYEMLHLASIDVRYNNGLVGGIGDLEELYDLASAMKAKSLAGSLKA